STGACTSTATPKESRASTSEAGYAGRNAAMKTRLTETRDWTRDAQFFEYTSAADPLVPRVPFAVFPAREHESGTTREIAWDLSGELGTAWQATSPGLLASFLRILPGESLGTRAQASSQMFFVIRGAGATTSKHGRL